MTVSMLTPPSPYLALPIHTFFGTRQLFIFILAYLLSLEEYLLLPVADDEGMK